MNPLLASLPAELKKKLKKQVMPNFEIPMLATLTDNYFSKKDWIYERKFDGVRLLLFKDKKRCWLKSRNNTLRSETYPEIVQALKKQPVDRVILDSELVTFDNNITSFEKLQPRLGVDHPSQNLIKSVKVYAYIFDILYLDGYDVTHLPLMTRKNILKAIISFKGPLRYTEHRNQGLVYFKQACKKGWEGIMAKYRYSPYVHVRSKHWLKFKCIEEQEMIITGFTDPQHSRIGFGSLLLGYYDGSKLMYAGNVGTGFSDQFLKTFSKKLKAIEINKNLFANKKRKELGQHYVKPFYVGEIGFEEWTKDNKLRQARFLGLRDDKNARDVIREKAKAIIPEN